jgi:type IV secretion system protein VirD4
MKQQKSFRSATLIWALLAVPVLGAAAVFACAYEDGMTLIDLLGRLTSLSVNPLVIRWTERTPAFLLGALVIYASAVALYYSARENRRPGEEHGSAKWGDPRQLGKKYRDREKPEANIILTQNVQMGLDGRKHRRNLNILVVGGSGAGKTRFFVKPNIMQASDKPGVGTSYLVTDPKGEVVRALAPFLIRQGYDVQVFDLIDPSCSDFYNPFAYLRDDKDVLKLINNLIKNTTPKTAQQQDPFWEKSEIALDSALILYLMHEAPPEEQSFETILYMIANGGAREDDDDYQSPLDLLFEALEEEEPEHIAVKQYKIFKQAAGKTAKSILVGAAVRLAAFNLPEIARMTSRDTLNLGSLGERKRAIFCVIPDNDASFNYIIGMLYTQCFQELYYRADKLHGGRLPVPVRCIFDEFANVALPDDFERVLATCRSRDISINMIIQNMAQLKTLFKDSWESITGNADSFLFLNGNEQTSHKYVSELLGKETLDTRTSSITRGTHGSSSVSRQQTGRELMTPDEVRALDNEYALLFIRGERPVMDKKYNILGHPNLKYTEDGGVEPYIHTPCPDYSIDDLDFPVESLDDIEILDEMEIVL